MYVSHLQAACSVKARGVGSRATTCRCAAAAVAWRPEITHSQCSVTYLFLSVLVLSKLFNRTVFIYNFFVKLYFKIEVDLVSISI